MPAPHGNSFWKARSSHGRAPIFKTPDDLWKACQEYFDWYEKNPLYEHKAFSYQGEIVITALPKMRATAISSLCIFLDISQPTWQQYRHREDFASVCTRVEEAIRAQKLQGASADLLNAAIIARDLGLTDKSEIKGAITLEQLVTEAMKG